MSYADNCDAASEIEQMDRDTAISRALSNKYTRLQAIGICHYCEAVVGPRNIFCGRECAEEHEYESARRLANVKVLR